MAPASFEELSLTHLQPDDTFPVVFPCNCSTLIVYNLEYIRLRMTAAKLPHSRTPGKRIGEALYQALRRLRL
jgi:hypothetical protein